MTTGVVFSKIATRSGYHIFDYVEYPSLIRGDIMPYEVHVSDVDVSHLNPSIDVLVCLNKETYEKHKARLTSSSLVVFDQDEFEIKEDIKKLLFLSKNSFKFKRSTNHEKYNCLGRFNWLFGRRCWTN